MAAEVPGVCRNDLPQNQENGCPCRGSVFTITLYLLKLWIVIEGANMSYFEELNNINVNGKTEKKNGLTYLSWAWAWGELKKKYPMSFYTVYEDARGLNYFTDNKTCYVKTGVTVVDGETQIEHIEYLPVMDYKNKSIPADLVTSFDVNKAIQRSLTKAVARHGLGLYIYAGEDLPETEMREAVGADNLASDADKKAFVAVCKKFKVEPKEILKQAGLQDGQKATVEILGKANMILRDMSEANK